MRTPRPDGGCHQCCTSPSTNCRAAPPRACARAQIAGRAWRAPSRPAAGRGSRTRRRTDSSRRAPRAGSRASDRGASGSASRRTPSGVRTWTAPRRDSHCSVTALRAVSTCAGSRYARDQRGASSRPPWPRRKMDVRAARRARDRCAPAAPRTDRAQRERCSRGRCAEGPRAARGSRAGPGTRRGQPSARGAFRSPPRMRRGPRSPCSRGCAPGALPIRVELRDDEHLSRRRASRRAPTRRSRWRSRGGGDRDDSSPGAGRS